MNFVAAFLWFAVMNNVGHQVVGCTFLMLAANLLCQKIPKFYLTNSEMHNRRILLFEERILSESLDVQDDEPTLKHYIF